MQNIKIKANLSETAYTTRDTCRVCNSKKLEFIFSLGIQYVNNFVKKEDIGKGVKAPLEMILCQNCSLLQLKHTAPQELLYSGFYWYRSGVTQTMKNALREIAETVSEMANLKKNDIVLDIGANDGTLLSFYPDSMTRATSKLKTRSSVSSTGYRLLMLFLMPVLKTGRMGLS